MKTRTHIQPPVSIESVIVTVRGEKALLDSDLARIYGVPTFRFNEAVKRNVDRFPEDFRFQLTADEWETVRRVRSQNALLDPQADLKSQIAISSRGHGGRRKLPWAFTEDFAFQLTPDEKAEVVANCGHLFVLRFSPVLPYAFTEPGAIMAANVLNGPQANRQSVSDRYPVARRGGRPRDEQNQ
jgi:hypothetical protein